MYIHTCFQFIHLLSQSTLSIDPASVYCRGVKIPALNDSRYIGLSVYNVVITSVIVVTMANAVWERVTLAFVLIASLIIMSTTTTLCLLFLPKVRSRSPIRRPSDWFG